MSAFHAAAAGMVREYTEQIAQLRSELQREIAENERLRTELGEAQAEVRVGGVISRELEGVRDELLLTIDRLNKERDKAQHRVTDLYYQLGEAQERATDAYDQLNSTNAAHNALVEECDRLRGVNAWLRDERLLLARTVVPGTGIRIDERKHARDVAHRVIAEAAQ